jgi:hypothetical protein
VFDETRARIKVVLRRRQAYRDLFYSGRDGQLSTQAEIVLADLRRACFLDRPTTAFAGNGSVDALATAENEGARRIGLRIQQALNLTDERLHRMLDASERADE